MEKEAFAVKDGLRDPDDGRRQRWQEARKNATVGAMAAPLRKESGPSSGFPFVGRPSPFSRVGPPADAA